MKVLGAGVEEESKIAKMAKNGINSRFCMATGAGGWICEDESMGWVPGHKHLALVGGLGQNLSRERSRTPPEPPEALQAKRDELALSTVRHRVLAPRGCRK